MSRGFSLVVARDIADFKNEKKKRTTTHDMLLRASIMLKIIMSLFNYITITTLDGDERLGGTEEGKSHGKGKRYFIV